MQLIEWLADWRRTGVDLHAQRQYVSDELVRIAEAGAPVLTHVLLAPFEVQTQLALSILAQDNPLPNHQYYLRLTPGVVLGKTFHRDAQGRDVGDKKRGEVLVAKVGTMGGRLNGSNTLPNAVTEPYSGPSVQRTANVGKDIYRYVDVPRSPVRVDREDAVKILRRYGNGIISMRYSNRGDVANQVDWWLVDEVPPSMVTPDGRGVRDLKAEAERDALEAATAPEPKHRGRS